jgi:hypothetical protein
MWVRSSELADNLEIDKDLLQQVVLLTPTTLEVYDVYVSKLIERVQFDGLSLLSPSPSLTTNGALPHLDSVGDVSHSMRVYKGKIFLLVSHVLPLWPPEAYEDCTIG